MKKIATLALAVGVLLSVVYAYNPPAGAEDMFLLSSPKTLSGSVPVTGGNFTFAGPDSIVVNPALPAREQRVALNAGYTFLFSTEEVNESQVGSAFQSGITIPTKMFVFSGYVNGTFVPFYEMLLGNSINAKAALSKEITDKLIVGAGVSAGYMWSYGKDWSLGANLGFEYDFGPLAFMKDFRFGASLLNLGKNYGECDRIGIKDGATTAYPTLITLKTGASATFFENDVMKVGGALDFTVPCFQNFIMDMNLQLSLKDMLVVSVGEKINIAESIAKKYNFIPSVGIIFKFSFDVKNNDYLESNGWSQSEMSVSAAYKNMYETVNAISAGVDINLGMKDTQAPEIVLW